MVYCLIENRIVKDQVPLKTYVFIGNRVCVPEKLVFSVRNGHQHCRITVEVSSY